MADLSALGELRPVEMLDLENYADAKESVFRLPPKGKYVLQSPDNFPPAAFGRTNAGALSAQIDPKIVGGPHDGFQLRFIKVSAKPYKRDGATVSQLGDYLRATGFKGVLKNEQEQADAVESTANSVYEGILDWRAYNKTTGFSVEGMERFPKNPDGTYQSWVEDPGDKDENGKPKKVRANITLSRFIPATS